MKSFTIQIEVKQTKISRGHCPHRSGVGTHKNKQKDISRQKEKILLKKEILC